MSRIFSILVALCALTTGSISASIHPVQAAPAAHDPLQPVMVRLSGSPLAADLNMRARTAFTKWRYRLDPTLPAALQYRQRMAAYQDREISYLKSKGLHFRVDRKYSVVFNGFSAHIRASEIPKLRSLENVSTVTLQAHFFPLLDKSIALVHAPDAWPQLGGAPNAGKGMMIANLDTGIDIKHPCFSDTGMAPPPLGRHADSAANLKLTNNKVIVARAFGGDPHKQFSAADSVGHGTFGAAIEACDYGTPTPLGTKISGVAPAAYLMSYDVFAGDACGNPSSSCDSVIEDPILAGLNAAILDGADVINMSLGSSLSSGDLSLDPFAQAVNLGTQAGVLMIVSAGNAGPTLQSVSSPAVASGAVAVGATTNSRIVVTSSVSVNGPAPVPAQLNRIRSSQGTNPWTGPIGPANMVFVGLGRKPNDDPDNPKADDFAGKDLHGKIALIQRGTTLFEQKVNNAMNAGAIAAIVFDSVDELSFSGDVKSATLPTAFISKSDGQALLAYLTAHPDATATLNSDTSTFDEPPNALSDFTSRGFGPDYSIKPDLVAPGQDIYSATENSIPNSDMYNPIGFTSASGTSFSAPHVTAAAALVLQKHPKWTPAMVKSVLVQTTDRVVKESQTNSSEPPVTEQGSGLLDVNNAVSATAYVTQPSLTFGQINTAITSGPLTGTLTLNDTGGGSGTWNVTTQTIEGGPGASLSVPASVQLPSGGHVDIPVRATVATSTPAGNFDGFITLTHGSQTLHLSFFLRSVNQPIKPGSVLLLDATTSRFQSAPPTPPVVHKSVDKYFRDALTSIGKSYTYWDDSKLGPPSVTDLKQASAVVVFTGANLNGFAAQNDNYEALLGPLGSLDVTAIRQYLDGGGRVFLSGLALPESDLYWTGYVLGADTKMLSSYDNDSNDKKQTGGISPPQPSTRPDTRNYVPTNPYIFGNMKQIDFSTKGDGAGDNVAVYSRGVAQGIGDGFVGVAGLGPINGKDPIRNSYGQAALETMDTGLGGPDVGIVSSDEPTLKSAAKYPGRSVLFSFDFAGINDNTGYATREQVLKRIFDWFVDKPTVAVKTLSAHAGSRTQLKATLHAVAGLHAVKYQWQIGSKTLAATKKPTVYTFPHPGTFKFKVLVTDSLGHKAVSSMKKITVR